jgi:glycerol-3-phosphate acyltransferase PlsY
MLDATTRGLLDKTIDEAKGAIPVALMRVTETTKEMHIQKVEDYVLGAANGFIIGKFFSIFSMLYQRYPDEQEMKKCVKL